MNKPSLQDQTERTVYNLERYERNWHIFKAVLFITLVGIIIAVQIYTFHRLLDNSDRNRRLLRCTVVTLTQPRSGQTPQEAQADFRNDLQECLDSTK